MNRFKQKLCIFICIGLRNYLDNRYLFSLFDIKKFTKYLIENIRNYDQNR